MVQSRLLQPGDELVFPLSNLQQHGAKRDRPNIGDELGELRGAADDEPTQVGAYTGTTSPYGAFDMGGDVCQWNEELNNSGEFRGLRGGAFDSRRGQPAVLVRDDDHPTDENCDIGFRVASIPEPSTAVLAVLACGMTLWWRKRK